MKFNIERFKKWRLFLLFLVIATALWYINKLNYSYKTEVYVHVRLTLDHNTIGWIENPEFDVLCMVDAKGGDVLRHNVRWNHLIEIPASALTLEPVGGYKYRITPNSFKEAVSAIQNKLDVIQMIDTLPALRIVPLEDVVLPIKSCIEINCHRQYMVVGDVVFTPSTVHVRAPRTMLDTLKSIKTQVVELDNINQSFSSNITLQCPAHVILSQYNVRYNFDVTGYTELEYNLAVEFENLPEGLNVIAAPSMVNVLVKVPLSSFRNAELHNPIATVDYNRMVDSRSKSLRVRIDSIPNGGQITQVTPEFIEPLFYHK